MQNVIKMRGVSAAAERAAAALSPATGAHASAKVLSIGVLAKPNISELAREYGKSRQTIRRWLENGWQPPAPATAEIVQEDQSVATHGHPPGRPWLLGLTCGALGLALAGVGLLINAQYAASLGRTMGESSLLAALGLA